MSLIRTIALLFVKLLNRLVISFANGLNLSGWKTKKSYVLIKLLIYRSIGQIIKITQIPNIERQQRR